MTDRDWTKAVPVIDENDEPCGHLAVGTADRNGRPCLSIAMLGADGEMQYEWLLGLGQLNDLVELIKAVADELPPDEEEQQ